MVNGRQKGARGEREWAEFLRDHGWPHARRGQQRSGVDQADVIDGPLGYHWEVKRVEQLNVWAALRQAERDAGENVPAVAMRRNRTPWVVVLPAEHALELIAKAQAYDALSNSAEQDILDLLG